MGTPWELDGNTLVTAYKIWKLTYGSSSSQVREWGYVLLRPGMGWGLKSQLAVIVYPTTCLPCTPFRMGIFDVPTHPELWDFVGS